MDTLINIGIAAVVVYLVIFVAMAGLVGAFFVFVWRDIQRGRKRMDERMERFK